VQVNTGIQSQNQYNMVAINLNGNIKTFSKIPSVWTDENGTHFNIKEGFGFLDVVTPTYDSRIEELSAIKLVGDVYTYDVIDRAIPQTLAELKTDKISQLKSMVGHKLSATDWYIIREADSGETTPTSVKAERADLRTQSNTIEAEIKSLTTKKIILLFDISI
jgi:hypothetical protein